MKTFKKLPGHQRSSTFAAIIRIAAARSTKGLTSLALYKFLLPVLILFTAHSSQPSAHAAMLGTEILGFTGTLDSIDFPLAQFGMVSTGIMTVSLAPNGVNVFGLDDITASGAIDVTLVVNIPLLAALGEPSPIIRIQEVGPASVTVGSSSGMSDFDFNAGLTGGGTVMTGILTGVTFQNVNAYNGEGFFGSWIPSGFADITWALNSSAQITFPAELTGGMQDFVVTGIDGNGKLSVVPEPGTLTLGLLGLLSVAGVRRLTRKKARRLRLG